MTEVITAGSEAHLRIRALSGVLTRYWYRFNSEVQLHARIAEALDTAGVAYERERVLSAADRADFLVDGIVIEAKVGGGGFYDALAQVGRYMEHDEVTGSLLVSTCAWARQPLKERPKWKGKPFGMVHLQRQAL